MNEQVPKSLLLEMGGEIYDLMLLSWVLENAGAEDALDLSQPEILMLELLGRCESMNVGDLQRRIGVNPSKMTRILNRMERDAEKPLVECKLNQSNRRKYDVRITEHGNEIRNAYRSAKIEAIAGILSQMPDAEREHLIRSLKAVREILFSTLVTTTA